jgi:hypothetical protein
MDCLFNEDDPKRTVVKSPSTYTEGNGVHLELGFFPDKLEEHKAEIISILKNLDESFFMSNGSGMSFLNFRQDRNGILWGSRTEADELLCLANALKIASFSADKKTWESLPGEVPFIIVEV